MIIYVLSEPKYQLIGGPGCPECGSYLFTHGEFTYDARIGHGTDGSCDNCGHEYTIVWNPASRG